MTTPKLEIHYDPNGEWAALYVDGRLEKVGDSYLAEERAFEILGVRVIQDDAFLRGQSQASGVAQTLDEVVTYAEEKVRRMVEAGDLREEAARLLAQADEISKGGAR